MSSATTPTQRPAASAAVLRHLHRAAVPLRMLTGLGRGVLVLGLLAWALTARFHWQELTQLAVVCFVLLALGYLWQVLPGTPVTAVTLRQQRTVMGAPASTALLEVQAGALPMLYPKLTVPVGGRSVSVRLPFLSPFAHHDETVQLPAMARGVHDVGPVTYDRTDPVGLVTRRLATGAPVQLLVGPRVTGLSVFAGGLTNDLDGATSTQLSMSDLAFHALREYVPGDDLRHVHWRSSAKAGEVLVRQYQETRRGHVTILLDGARSSYPVIDDFELAVSVAASIALRSVRDDFDTYLRCGDLAARGRDAAAMTEVSCRFETSYDDYAAQAAYAAATVGSTGLLVQVTGSARELADLEAAARRFGRGADWIVVRADSTDEARLRDGSTLRELSVPDLDRLRVLMARGLR